MAVQLFAHLSLSFSLRELRWWVIFWRSNTSLRFLLWSLFIATHSQYQQCARSYKHKPCQAFHNFSAPQPFFLLADDAQLCAFIMQFLLLWGPGSLSCPSSNIQKARLTAEQKINNAQQVVCESSKWERIIVQFYSAGFFLNDSTYQ